MVRNIIAQARRELRGNLWLWLAALVLFVGVPLWELNHGRFEERGIFTGLVYVCFTWPFVILLGSLAACRDLDEDRASFIQVPPGRGRLRWLAVKWGSGVLILLITLGCALFAIVTSEASNAPPPIPDIIIDRPAEHLKTGVLAAYGFSLLLLLYSASLLVGCAERKAGRAAPLAALAAGLIVGLPLLSPALDWLCIFTIDHLYFESPAAPGDVWLRWSGWGALHAPGSKTCVELTPRFWAFLAAMLAGSATAFTASLAAARSPRPVRRGLRIAVLAGGVIFLVGYALITYWPAPELKATAVTRAGGVNSRAPILFEGGRFGYATAYKFRDKSYPVVRSFAPEDPEFPFGDVLPMSSREVNLARIPKLPGRPGPDCFAYKGDESGIAIMRPNAQGRPTCVANVDLPEAPPVYDEWTTTPYMVQAGDFVYCHDEKKGRLFVVALKSPGAPRPRELDADSKAILQGYQDLLIRTPAPAALELPLLPLPGLTPGERFLVGAWLTHWRCALSGDILAVVNGRRDLLVYRLAQADEDKIRFERIAMRRMSPLTRIRANGVRMVAFQKGFLAVLGYRDGLRLYDLQEPSQPRVAGRYAPERMDFSDMMPLPDGRILLAGRAFHIVAAPTP